MKVLIVGLGSIAKKHINALIAIDINIELFALRSSIESEKLSNVKNIYDFEELPDDLDFIIISNPTHLHYEYIKLLSDKKIPLFIEKPLVHVLSELEDLITSLDLNNIITYVACNLRFHPCLQFLNDYIKNTPHLTINEVNVYCGSYLPDWRPNRDFRQIYSANVEMGGGVHLDLFHEIDYVAWIFGLPHDVKVVKSNNSSLNINAIDYANYNLRYDKFTANIILNYYRPIAKREIEILFDKEIWTVDLLKCQIKNSKNELLFQDTSFKILDTYKLQLDYFIEKLNDNIVIMNSAQESAAVLKICLTDE